jgi:hypothetical protein
VKDAHVRELGVPRAQGLLKRDLTGRGERRGEGGRRRGAAGGERGRGRSTLLLASLLPLDPPCCSEPSRLDPHPMLTHPQQDGHLVLHPRLKVQEHERESPPAGRVRRRCDVSVGDAGDARELATNESQYGFVRD